MQTRRSLASALKLARKARGLSQEAFADVSSRTYLSTLERGMKSPTLNKIAAICQVLGNPSANPAYAVLYGRKLGRGGGDGSQSSPRAGGARPPGEPVTSSHL